MNMELRIKSCKMCKFEKLLLQNILWAVQISKDCSMPIAIKTSTLFETSNDKRFLGHYGIPYNIR